MSATIPRTPTYSPPRRPLLVQGQGGQPKLLLRAADGASAEVYLHGGQLTSWRPAGGDECLFLSSQADFGEDAVIRGGVPVIFPQFGTEGRLPKHGFARQLDWELEYARETADGGATVTLRLTDSRASWALWRHRFVVDVTVTVSGNRLVQQLTVKNDGKKRFRFTAALHTYLRILDIAAVSLRGLHGRRYRDQCSGEEREERSEVLTVAGELDRVYLDVADPLVVCDGERRIELTMSGFSDVVVWNPGPERAAALPDLEPSGYRRFLCVEPAVVGRAVWLEPGASWVGVQQLRMERIQETP